MAFSCFHSESETRGVRKVPTGITGLCSQTSIAMLLFDPLMSALLIIAKRIRQTSDCSPANRERELGLDQGCQTYGPQGT